MPARLVTSALVIALSACHPTERFEAIGQIVRSDAIEVDEQGKVLLQDVEIEWSACPGDQFQVVRGGAEFAACVRQHALGELVSLQVVHFWDELGFYRWDVTRVGGCDRPPQPDAEGSYERSQECVDLVHHGALKAGFHCDRKPFAKLVEICPWMARR